MAWRRRNEAVYSARVRAGLLRRGVLEAGNGFRPGGRTEADRQEFRKRPPSEDLLTLQPAVRLSGHNAGSHSHRTGRSFDLPDLSFHGKACPCRRPSAFRREPCPCSSDTWRKPLPCRWQRITPCMSLAVLPFSCSRYPDLLLRILLTPLPHLV